MANLWKWLYKRSPFNPHNMPVPNPGTGPSPDRTTPARAQPLEIGTTRQPIVGSLAEFVSIQSSVRGVEGELATSEVSLAILLGCHHIVSQLQAEDKDGRHIRGIAGRCVYCSQEMQAAIASGQIDPQTADRLSLICTDCAALTASGHLCCPKHRVAVSSPDGKPIYFGPDDIEAQRKHDVMNKVWVPFMFLFGKDPQQPSAPDLKENGHAES
jgi:hypothetical protein